MTSLVTETASMLDVGPVEAEDVVGMLVKGVDEVKRVERLFAGFQANWAPDNQAPDSWAPDNWAPDSWAPGQLGPGQLGPRTVGPRTVGPLDSWAPDSWAPGPNCPP